MPYPNSQAVSITDLLAAMGATGVYNHPRDIVNQASAVLVPAQPQNYEAQTLRDMYLQQANNQYPMVYRGMVQPGNLDLYNRPVLNNADGSYSTTSSMSFNDGQYEVVVPTVAGTSTGQVVRLTPEQAMQRYFATGQHLGKFTDWQPADDYAQRIHEMQERAIAANRGQPFRMGYTSPNNNQP